MNARNPYLKSYCIGNYAEPGFAPSFHAKRNFQFQFNTIVLCTYYLILKIIVHMNARNPFLNRTVQDTMQSWASSQVFAPKGIFSFYLILQYCIMYILFNTKSNSPHERKKPFHKSYCIRYYAELGFAPSFCPKRSFDLKIYATFLGQRVLFRSERSGLFRSFFEILATFFLAFFS